MQSIRGHINDFDFLTGSWHVAHRRLTQRWVGSDDWDEFRVVGGFDGAVGTFEGPDTDDGRPITVRFRWDVVDDDHARWQQAFSEDGETWETNWIMEFTRR